MHINQQKLLNLAKSVSLKNMTLRQIGDQVGILNPQNVKFHLQKLVDRGFLTSDYQLSSSVPTNLVAVPIYGSANCGPATFIAQDNIQGYLKVSPSIVSSGRNLFSLKAVGNSMNEAKVEGKYQIREGDYIIADSSKRPNNSEYGVIVNEGLVNIKKIKINENTDPKTVALISESTENFPPIILTVEDFENGLVDIVGKVVKVIPFSSL
ncbi:hypothetical protein HGA88_01795 [Candidatus Roizmanbacteria bacterium]|nr:hypothetical protein [Candidatus Roizmanbacteria bacterium]